MSTNLQPLTNFAPPATPYLASSADGVPPSGKLAAALFGAPLDITESFRSGAHGGPAAVRYMSDGLETYSPVLDRDLETLRVADLGDLRLQELSIEQSLDAISDAMAYAAEHAKLAVMVGGEHTGSLGGYRGLKRIHPDAVILQADAHLDMRSAYEGQALTH